MTDTIAAIATALTNSGIGIIRVSGQNSIEIVNKIYVNKNRRAILKDISSHSIHYGFILDNSKEILDEVMVSVMKGPNSFTTEDTVEINCHGGILIMNKILELVLSKGARLAEPGEFTKRAYLNGRIDLSEAEAVMDVISSENELALRASVKQLKGNLSTRIIELRKEILYEIAFIESALDDPEHIDLAGYPEKLKVKIADLIDRIISMLKTADNGRMVREGIQTVILGKPNAGKSSFLNLLLGEERAIVTQIPGTTRDILEEKINLNGIWLRMIDTAGIRQTQDVVEKIGVERAKKYANDADLVIYMIDSSVDLDENDIEIVNLIKDKKSIVLFNKSDLQSKTSFDEVKKIFEENQIIIRTSVKNQTGLNEFENVIRNLFFKGDISINNEIMITNLRHKKLLEEALESLIQVKSSIEELMPEDFFSIDLMNGYRSLGKIIGEEVEEDLVNEIFAKFCMGK